MYSPAEANPDDLIASEKQSLSREKILNVIQDRLLKWIGLGIVLFVLWGQSNAWPGELVFSAVLLPLMLLFTQRHYLNFSFARYIPVDIQVWEFMISCLLLTVGIASGKLTLISIGWVSIGIVFLKPTRVDLNWAEWFKIPILWMFLFPVWLDFRNNSLNICQFLVGNPIALPTEGLPTSWDYTRFHFGIITSLIVQAGILRGSLFWKCLILIPGVAFFYSWLQTLLPEIRTGLGPLQMFCSWLLTPATVGAVSWLIHQTSHLTRIHEVGPTTEYIRRHRFSGFILWLSFAVIAMQQFNLIKDTFFIKGTLPINHLALIFWVAGLFWLRRKTPVSNIDTRSRVLLTLALAFLITGEWTDVNFMRHLSLGLGILTLASWKRVWPTGMLLTILTTWALIIPAGQLATTTAISMGLGNPLILALALTANALAFSLYGLNKRDDLRLLNSGDYEWLPSMRFSFLILMLLISFQLLSSIGNQHFQAIINISNPNEEIYENEAPVIKGVTLTRSTANEIPGLNRMKFYDVQAVGYEDDPAEAILLAAEPVQRSYELPSPFMVLKSLGWHADQPSLVYQDGQSAMEVRIRSIDEPSKFGRALFWWKNLDKTFYSYQKAQRILWSSWFHAQRQVSLYVMIQEVDFGSNLNDKRSLRSMAHKYKWFFAPERNPANPDNGSSGEPIQQVPPIPLSLSGKPE